MDANIEQFNKQYDYLFKKYKDKNDLKENANNNERKFLYIFDTDYYWDGSKKFPENTCKLGITEQSINIRLNAYDNICNIRNIECIQSNYIEERERFVKAFLKHKTNFKPIAGKEYFIGCKQLIKFIYIILYHISDIDIISWHTFYNNKAENYNDLFNYVYLIYDRIINDSSFNIKDLFCITSDNNKYQYKLIKHDNVIFQEEQININNIYLCKKCNTEFIKKAEYSIHIETCKVNQCELCNQEFYNITSLQNHLKICLQLYIKDNNNLNKEILSKDKAIITLKEDINNFETKLNVKDETINKLQIELLEYKEKYINFNISHIESKNKDLYELQALSKYNLKQIEDLKNLFISYNTNKTKIKNENIIVDEYEKNIILCESPEIIINSIDMKNIFQLNTEISNEHDFANIFANNHVTKHILIIDQYQYKVNYINKNSELISDDKCYKLSYIIYSLCKDSAEKFIREYNELEYELEENMIINGRGNTTKAKKLLLAKYFLASRIIDKDDKSLEKFGKQLIKYSKPIPKKYS